MKKLQEKCNKKAHNTIREIYIAKETQRMILITDQSIEKERIIVKLHWNSVGKSNKKIGWVNMQLECYMLYEWLIENLQARATKATKEVQLLNDSGPSGLLSVMTFRTSQKQNSKGTSIHGQSI